jgi:hypothetical protein
MNFSLFLRAAATFVLPLVASACLRVPQESGGLAAVKASPEVTAAQLQSWVYETGRRFSSRIESTADTIAARTTDPSVRIQALRWKTIAIPLIEEASLRSEPVVAAADLWAFTIQQADFLERGDGRDAFGPFQPFAVATADTLRQLAADLAGRMRMQDYDPAKADRALRDWAARHPIRGNGLQRESILGSDWPVLGISASSLFGTAASLERSLVGVSNRLGYLNEGMFKRALWQSELAARNLATGAPSLLDRGREAFLGDLSERQHEVFADIDRQRTATLAAITGERVAVLDGVREERTAVLAAVRAERMAVLEAVRAERIATLAAMDSLVQRSLEHAGGVAERLLLLAVLPLFALGILALGAVLLLRRRAPG